MNKARGSCGAGKECSPFAASVPRPPCHILSDILCSCVVDGYTRAQHSSTLWKEHQLPGTGLKPSLRNSWAPSPAPPRAPALQQQGAGVPILQGPLKSSSIPGCRNVKLRCWLLQRGQSLTPGGQGAVSRCSEQKLPRSQITFGRVWSPLPAPPPF